jgi:hypothetical protein
VGLGASALGVLGDVLQEISASQRSRGDMAAGNHPASPLSAFAAQALQALQAVCEPRSPDPAADQGAYKRRWRAKE